MTEEFDRCSAGIISLFFVVFLCRLVTFHREVKDRRYPVFLEYKLTKLERKSQQNSVGLSISCSATLEQLFRFGATFSPSSNFSDFVQRFSFLKNFLAFLRQFVTKNRTFKF